MNLLNYIKQYIKHYKNAFAGLKVVSREINFWAELAIGVILVISSLIFNPSHVTILLWFILWGLLVVLEAINTAVEKLADFVYPKYHDQIKDIKDVSAFAVLLTGFILLVVFVLGLLAFI